MKTSQEQLAFSNNLTDLTNKLGVLISNSPKINDKEEMKNHIFAVQKILDEMDSLRSKYST